jgi:hypothetical protein
VDAQRSAVRSIAWLDLILAIRRVSHQFLFVAVSVEQHLALCKRNDDKLGSLEAAVSRPSDYKRLTLNVPSPTVDDFRCVFMPLDAPCAVGVVYLEFPRTEPTPKDRLRIIAPRLTGSRTDKGENHTEAENAHEI